MILEGLGRIPDTADIASFSTPFTFESENIFNHNRMRPSTFDHLKSDERINSVSLSVFRASFEDYLCVIRYIQDFSHLLKS